MFKKKKYNILLIQDNIGDSISLERAAVRVEANIHIEVIKSGIKFKGMIQNNQIKPIPDMIWLDINLPGINGLDLLKLLKEHKKYKTIPVIILTTSERDYQINTAYAYHANSYFSKKIDPEDIDKFVKLINDYWFNQVCLPTKDDE